MSDARARLKVLLGAVLLLAALLALILPMVLLRPSPRPAGFDYIADQAAKLGHDRGRIVRFVQEQIRAESYTGCLRGPVGTLWSGAGNDVDRAALLAALLRAGGRKVRFARGQTIWVQLREQDKWLDLRTAPAAESRPVGPSSASKPAPWTG